MILLRELQAKALSLSMEAFATCRRLARHLTGDSETRLVKRGSKIDTFASAFAFLC